MNNLSKEEFTKFEREANVFAASFLLFKEIFFRDIDTSYRSCLLKAIKEWCVSLFELCVLVYIRLE